MHPANVSARSYLLLIFLTWLNVLNFADRTLLGSLAKQIADDPDIDIPYDRIGFLTGYGFVIFYTAIGIGLGALADRVHRPRLIAAGLLLWSALTAATGYVRAFLQMAVCRGLIGVGEAALTPASLSMLAHRFPPRSLAFATGAYYAGIPLGAGIGMIVSGFLLPSFGWRGCFRILGFLGLLFVIPLLFLRDPRPAPLPDASKSPRATPNPAANSTGVLAEFVRTLVRSPSLVCLIIAASLLVYMQASTIFILAWVQEERGLTYEYAAPLGGVLYLIGGTGGSLLGGVASDYWRRRFGPSGRVWFLACVIALFMPLSVWFYLSDAGSVMFKPLWLLTAFGTMVWYGSMYSTVPDLAPARSRATSIACLIFCVNVFGQGLGPLVTGWYGKAGAFTEGLLLSSAVGALALPFVIVAARRYERDQQLVATPAP